MELGGVLIPTPLLAPSRCVGLDFLLLHPLLAKGHHWRGEGFLLDQHGACVFFLLETVELTISLESKSVQNRVVEPFN